MSWQPIETAPKSGRMLLFYPATRPARGHAGNTLSEMVRVGRPADTPYRPPTHWAPIPELPT